MAESHVFDELEAASAWNAEAGVFDGFVIVLTACVLRLAVMFPRATTLNRPPLPSLDESASSLNTATTAEVARVVDTGRTVHRVALALALAMFACPVVALVRDARGSGSGMQLGDEILLAVCFAVIAGCRAVVRHLDSVTSVVWQLTLVAGLPRLLSSVGPHGRVTEYCLMAPLYALSALQLCVAAVTPGAVDCHPPSPYSRNRGAPLPRAPCTTLLCLRLHTSLARAMAVFAIAAKCDGAENVGSWSWTQTLLPLWWACLLHLCTAAVVAITLRRQRWHTPSESSRLRTVHPVVTDKAWMTRFCASGVLQCATFGGAGGLVTFVLLALSLDGRLSVTPWAIAAPLVAQVALAAVAWIITVVRASGAARHRLNHRDGAPHGTTDDDEQASVLAVSSATTCLGALAALACVVLLVMQLSAWRGVHLSWYVVFGLLWATVAGIVGAGSLSLTLWSKDVSSVSCRVLWSACTPHLLAFTVAHGVCVSMLCSLVRRHVRLLVRLIV